MTLNPAYTIGVTTYRGRWSQFTNLAQELEIECPDIPKIYYLNGHRDPTGQDIYLREAEKFISSISVYATVLPQKQPCGMAKMWNQIILHAPTDKVWLLNDDILLRVGARATLDRVSLEREFCTFTNSWSFFMVSKKVVAEIGWFDEFYEEIGSEDADYCIRIFLSNPMLYTTVLNAPWTHQHSPAPEADSSWDMEIAHGKYSRKNEDYFNRKWWHGFLPEDGSIYLPMYDMYVKQLLPTPLWYPLPAPSAMKCKAKWYNGWRNR